MTPHDPKLLARLDAMPRRHFDGQVFRAGRQGLDPLQPSVHGGRWMPAAATPILYTSLMREGALAEVAYHWSQLNPMPSRPAVVYTLAVKARRTLKLVQADLATLGVAANDYGGINLPRTREIGAAVAYLGCDGLIAPSARWASDNLMLFIGGDPSAARLAVVASEEVAWLAWGRANAVVTP
jgi:hypothetical protein